MLGLTIATLLGVPLATAFGQTLGWRAAFATIGGLAILLIWRWVPVVSADALQTRLMDVAADAQTLAAALNHSAFNIANALGAWVGGLTIAAGYGWTSTGWVGALFALGGLAVFAMSLLVDDTLRGRSRSSSAAPLR